MKPYKMFKQQFKININFILINFKNINIYLNKKVNSILNK